VSAGNTVMTRRTTIVIAAVGIVLLLAIGGTVAWWRYYGKSYLDAKRQEGVAFLAQGAQLGKTLGFRACLEKAASHGDSCGPADLLCEVNAQMLVRGCAQTTKDLPEYCASLPPYDDRLARVGHAIELCTEFGLKNERCGRTITSAGVICEKLRQGNALPSR
jgi:hypothetical protein